MKIPYEYFCNDCGQLRLKLNHTDECGNCGSSNIVKGKVGKLDKDKLKEQWIIAMDKEIDWHWLSPNYTQHAWHPNKNSRTACGRDWDGWYKARDYDQNLPKCKTCIKVHAKHNIDSIHEAKALKEFKKKALFIKLNSTEGYYECEGHKGLDTRRVFVSWANAKYSLNLRS